MGHYRDTGQCGSYEAKHCYFKKLAQSVGNFINLPWTVAMRHQMLQCYEYSCDASILDLRPEILDLVRMEQCTCNDNDVYTG